MILALNLAVGDVLFWISNLAIVMGYTTVAAYFAKTNDRDVRRDQKIAGLCFFFLCASTHVELAIHGITGYALLEKNVSWHMILIHVPQGVSIWVMIYTVARHGITLPPIERRKPPEPKPEPGGRRSYDP